jgi:NAD(P)-dependent dehydrogenase (short-subunit alcohol dehydrogenase family)
MRFTGKYALVTGSSRGIGRGIALRLAQEGATIGVHYYRNHEAAADTLARIRELGADGVIVQADVTHAEDVSRMFREVRDTFGALDIFVSNARGEVGTFYEPPLAIGLDKFDHAMDSQAKAFLVGAREAATLMRSGGRIIAITYAPGGVYGSWQSWVAMGAAKSALESLARYMAVALAPRAITVNIVSPGWIDDSVLNTLPTEVIEMIRSHHERGWTPMRRLGTPADIGNAVALFCSSDADWITGQLVAVDGGMSLMDPGLPLGIQQPELQPVGSV